MTNEEISAGLVDIVNEFNQRFMSWMEATQCRANLGWQYGFDRQVKCLEILEVNRIVYRKLPPDKMTLESLLGKT